MSDQAEAEFMHDELKALLASQQLTPVAQRKRPVMNASGSTEARKDGERAAPNPNEPRVDAAPRAGSPE